MSHLFETIRVLDGKLQNIIYHNARLNQSRKVLFNVSDSVQLEECIRIPSEMSIGIYKCKVLYDREIQNILFEPYIKRTIRSLKLIEDNTITYNFKFTDRDQLNQLLGRKENCGDILIVKDNLITDTSFSNIIFFDGTQWITPSTPLLQGTMRSFLLKEKIIVEKEINLTDLKYFKKARLINAMLPFESGSDIQIENIKF
jgi:4-amino-4-deoxychorismate lyase